MLILMAFTGDRRNKIGIKKNMSNLYKVNLKSLSKCSFLLSCLVSLMSDVMALRPDKINQ